MPKGWLLLGADPRRRGRVRGLPARRAEPAAAEGRGRHGLDRDRGPGHDPPDGHRLRRGRAQGRSFAQDHVAHHRAQRHRGDAGQEGRRHRAAGLDGPGRPARGGPGQLGQRAGGARPAEGDLRPGPGDRSPRSTRRPRSEAATRARVRYIEALLDYTIIRAPFAGVITAKRAFVGEAVSPFGSSPSGGGSGGAIATLVEFSSLYVGADVNEANLSKLAKNQPAEISLDAVPDKTYHGRLRQIVPAADRQKATVRVKVAFLDADDRVLPDLSARVAFTAEPTQGKEARSRIVVPKATLTDGRRKEGRLPGRRRPGGLHAR